MKNGKLKVGGIGVDIEKISRFSNFGKNKNQQFLKKVFSEEERRYCFSKDNPTPHLAVRFSAKEAVIKALSQMGIKAPNHNQIKISRDGNIPEIVLPPKILKGQKIKLGLSHCQDHAIAFVIISD